jgi:hypothetical protein
MRIHDAPAQANSVVLSHVRGEDAPAGQSALLDLELCGLIIHVNENAF